MTRDDISRWAREAGVSIRGHYDETGSTPAELQRFAELVAAAERKECAALCDRFQARDVGMQPAECAAAIRAMNKQEQSE